MTKYLITIFTLSLLSTPAAADWSSDGFAMHTIKHGTVNGGIYIEGGHGKEYTTSYTQNFTVPNGTMKWARLYVSAKDTPWLNVSLNGHLLGNYTNLASNSKVYSNYKTDDQGMYWAYYDNVADYLVNGNNTATADLGSRVGLNTKSWGIMLIAVYEGGDRPELIEYWVNQGNPLLHGNHPPFASHHNTTNTSFVGITDVNNITHANIWTVYIWGSEESEPEPHDTLWFNSELIAEDASDGAGTDDQGSNWRGACFDLEKWDVNRYLIRDNVLSFDRGEDSILCPVGAVLVLKRDLESAPTTRVVQHGATVLPAISLVVTPVTLDFGKITHGEQSKIQMLTLSNTGKSTITVTADITDIVNDLYISGLLLDSVDWSTYSKSILTGEAVDASIMLNIPDDYAEVGIQEGKLTFWISEV
ncbi:MAG: DUF3344 domain-containing protein [ANME-2 cluster archaeon]|jgi:hypothetical protein|nr:DUF3344 domain-containing protein [ANME-2 cluster archaeon]